MRSPTGAASVAAAVEASRTPSLQKSLPSSTRLSRLDTLDNSVMMDELVGLSPVADSPNPDSPPTGHILICHANDKMGMLMRSVLCQSHPLPTPAYGLGPAVLAAGLALRAREAAPPPPVRVVVLCPAADRPTDLSVEQMHPG